MLDIDSYWSWGIDAFTNDTADLKGWDLLELSVSIYR
jgi:hypothetical protein